VVIFQKIEMLFFRQGKSISQHRLILKTIHDATLRKTTMQFDQ
jgi:hypothetical protein